MYYQIKPLLLVGDAVKDLFHLFEVTQIATDPGDICLGVLLLDLLDRLVTLLFLSVGHDDASTSLRESSGDFVSDTEGTT